MKRHKFFFSLSPPYPMGYCHSFILCYHYASEWVNIHFPWIWLKAADGKFRQISTVIRLTWILYGFIVIYLNLVATQFILHLICWNIYWFYVEIVIIYSLLFTIHINNPPAHIYHIFSCDLSVISSSPSIHSIRKIEHDERPMRPESLKITSICGNGAYMHIEHCTFSSFLIKVSLLA